MRSWQASDSPWDCQKQGLHFGGVFVSVDPGLRTPVVNINNKLDKSKNKKVILKEVNLITVIAACRYSHDLTVLKSTELIIFFYIIIFCYYLRIMKIVKFRSYLIPLVLSGEKNSTWRLFDDKNLTVGDVIELREFITLRHFANAQITKVIEKSFVDLDAQDKLGHETFESNEEMYKTYSKYYQTDVGPSTTVKVIWFDLIQKL